MTGMRAGEVNKLATKEKISKEEALKRFIERKVAKDTAIALRKDGTRYCRYSNKHLARLYASERVNQLKDDILMDGSSIIWFGILRKWIDFCESWEKGLFDRPRFKKYGQTSAIQKQIQEQSSFTFGHHVDLTWCGSPCLEKVEVVPDRPIPDGGTIKQIALTKNTIGKWYISCFVEAEKSVFARDFGSSEGKVVGIDPGMKTALTTSDGEKFTPKGLSKDNQLEKKLKRLYRQLDRQTRACNPQCFAEDGTWKRRHRITFRSKRMLETTKKIAEIKLHFKDAKTDFYHNLAIYLLKNYDTIGVGNSKMHTLVRGQGKQKHAFNEKSREHAISDFKTKLKDKASLSLTPKGVYDINEAYTTRTCSACGHLDGPKDVSIRQWACPKCNTVHDRDVNAAINIKNQTISAMKAAASQSVSGAKAPKVRRSTKVPKKQSPRSTETTKSQEGGPMSIPFASGQVMAQVSMDARIPCIPVTEHDTKVLSSVDSASPSEKMGHSQSQEDVPISAEVTQQRLQ